MRFPYLPLPHFFPHFFPSLSLTTSIEGGARVGEVNATRRDITSFPLNSPLSIRAISRQRSDRYNRFGLIPVNCRRPKFTSRVPREQAIPHLRQTSTRPIQRHLNSINHATRGENLSILLFPRNFGKGEGGAFPRRNFAPRRSTRYETRRRSFFLSPVDSRFSTNRLVYERV